MVVPHYAIIYIKHRVGSEMSDIPQGLIKHLERISQEVLLNGFRKNLCKRRQALGEFLNSILRTLCLWKEIRMSFSK